MNVPAIAKKTYEALKSIPEYSGISNFISQSLQQISSPVTKAEFIHEAIDEFNKDVFSHPLVQQLSPCKLGCSACCHTQVSVTQEEAILLLNLLQSGISIDSKRLEKQFLAQNDAGEYYKLSFDERKCVFLDENGGCKVYKDRPSVCRTNGVLGDSAQCDTTSAIQSQRLIKTPRSDMAIYSFFAQSPESGSLPYILGKLLGLSKS